MSNEQWLKLSSDAILQAHGCLVKSASWTSYRESITFEYKGGAHEVVASNRGFDVRLNIKIVEKLKELGAPLLDPFDVALFQYMREFERSDKLAEETQKQRHHFDRLLAEAWVAAAYNRADLPKAIMVWHWRDAPGVLRAMSDHVGDEDWVAIVPRECYEEHPLWMDDGTPFGRCSVSEFEFGSFFLRIGAHS